MEYVINPILEANFHTSSRNKLSYKVQINEKCLCIVKSQGSGVKTKIINITDIIGCRCTRRRKKLSEKCECHPNDTNVFPLLDNDIETKDASAYLHIYTYVLKDFIITSGRKREQFKITLRFRLYSRYEDNLKEALKWKNAIKHLIAKTQTNSLLGKNLPIISSENGDIRQSSGKLLVILNPKSGPGKSREIFQEQVLPILIEAELEYDLYVTKAQNDARNLMRTSNVLKWKKGIIVIGGDGVLYEVVNGIMERPDWKNIINTIPFGIIPGGSGNGLAKSLSVCTNEPYDSNPVLIATLNILKGIPVPIDLVRIETQTEVAFSFLSFGWGLLADIDIESERLRMIGSPRFTIWSMARLIGLRTYTGRLSFLRIPEEKVKEAASSDKYIEIQIQDIANGNDEHNDKKYTNNFDCNSNFSFDMDSISLDTGCNQCDNDKVIRTESFYSLNSHKSAYLSADKTSSYQSLPEITKNNKKMIYGPVSQLPSLNKPVPKSWEVYQGEFVLIHATYQSHLAGDVFFAPSCKPNDGIIWLVVIKAGISRVELFQFLLGLSSGNHLKLPQIELIPVLAFRLEPFCKGSHIVVDGELIEHSSIIQAEIFPGLISALNLPKTENT